MNQADCDRISGLVSRRLQERLSVLATDDGCVVRLPIEDGDGDPITLSVRSVRGNLIVDDAGAIAAHLYTLGQQYEDTPALKLLTALGVAYGCSLNYDYGTVEAETSEATLVDTIMTMARLAITVLTAMPHVRVRAFQTHTLGPRLRTRIRNAYDEAEILQHVEPGFRLPGAVVESWPIDFHWQVERDRDAHPPQSSGPEELVDASTRKDVFVIAVDLDVQEPLRKVERLSSLVVDTRSQLTGNDLRVVVDGQGRDSDSTIATRFLRQHSTELGYSLFDFGDSRERGLFVRESSLELLGRESAAWRALWIGQRASR